MAIDDLVIVNLPVDIQGVHTTDLNWPGKTAWFRGETCARHLLVGTEGLLEGLRSDTMEYSEHRDGNPLPKRIIPNPIKAQLRDDVDFSHEANPSDGKQPMILRGKAAYEFLVRMITGLESNVPADYEVVNQIRARLTAYEADLQVEVRDRLQQHLSTGQPIPAHPKELDTAEMSGRRATLT